jgi:hypothetical protein
MGVLRAWRCIGTTGKRDPRSTGVALRACVCAHPDAPKKTMVEEGMTMMSSLACLSDAQLIAAVKARAASERQATAQLIASLAELDARRLYLGEGCASLFAYCTRVLHLSEHAAYGRIEAARAVRRFPCLLASSSGPWTRDPRDKCREPGLRDARIAAGLAVSRVRATRREPSSRFHVRR